MPQGAGEERWRWLYGQLRAAILDHRLPPGARVPSSRNLAKQYGVSRGTVVAAVDHLRSEGYLETHVGAGAFVATATPDEAICRDKQKGRRRPKADDTRNSVQTRTSERTRRVAVAGFAFIGQSFSSVGTSHRPFPYRVVVSHRWKGAAARSPLAIRSGRREGILATAQGDSRVRWRSARSARSALRR